MRLGRNSGSAAEQLRWRRQAKAGAERRHRPGWAEASAWRTANEVAGEAVASCPSSAGVAVRSDPEEAEGSPAQPRSEDAAAELVRHLLLAAAVALNGSGEAEAKAWVPPD